MSRPQALAPQEIQARLARIPEWQLTPAGEITRSFRFPSFSRALLFVDSVGFIAEQLDHHPDIDIRYNQVALRVKTHSAGALTELDFQLAERINAL